VRLHLRAAVLGCVFAAGIHTAAVAQSWKEAALASFDEVWKTINESFYDPTFGGIDWAGVAKALRPRVASAASNDAARVVIREMLAKLGRSHFGLLTSAPAEMLPGPASVPIEFRVSSPQTQVVVTRVTDAAATKAGLAPGQTIVSIDGNEVAGFSKGLEELAPRPAGLEVWRRVNRALHGWDGSRSTLVVNDVGGGARTVIVSRTLTTGEVSTIGNLPPLRTDFEAREVETPGGRKVGVIAFNIWMPALADRIADAVDRFRGHAAIVIDLRGNPGGLAAMMGGVAGHFLAEPVALGTMRTRYAPAPLVFNANPRTVTTDGRRVDVYRGPLAIIVDELTGSTSETFVGALQGLGRARVFGRATMGQALPAMTKQLPSGDVLMYAVGDFTTSSGKSLEGAGVTPDTVVPLSPRALAAGRDDPLEAALRWVDRGGQNH